MLCRIAVSLACCLACLPVAAAVQGGWSFEILGTLGGNASWGAAVNNAGEIVGWAGLRKGEFTDVDPEFHAFSQVAGRMRDLGPATGNSSARALSEQGEVVGMDGAGNVFAWKNGTAKPLGFTGTPNAVNRSGWIVGTRDSTAGDFRGFLYRNGVLSELGTLGGSWSTAVRVNDWGTIVGSSVNAAGMVRGFVQRDGRMREIGTFGGAVSQAYGLNHYGVVVGSAGNAQGGVQAFIDDGTMRPLFAPASPYDVAEAFAINNAGHVVGVVNDQGFLWDGKRVTVLRDLLTPAQQAQWGVLTPQDINDRGWIVGVASTWGVNGIPGGYRRAFVLKPK